nr:hypothetical protein [Tanacetum cinerariifolium]
MEKSIEQSDLECYECEAVDDSDSIQHIKAVNTPYPVAQKTTEPNEVEREQLYSASTNEIDEKKHELKILPQHSEYAYLHGDKYFPIIISSNYIKGISPSYCTHKILMEDDYKPVIQPQRHLNPKVQDVVKNKIVKLLDSGAKNLAADHLLRLENPDLGTFTEEEIADKFPDEHLMILKTKLHEDEPWLFARFGVLKALISDRGAKNLAADHLLRLENPDLGTFTEEEIADKFPDEHLMILKTKLHEDEPCIYKDAKYYVIRCNACQRSGNISSRSEMPQNNIQAFRTAYKTPTRCTPFRLVYEKACHLPVEIKHKAYWALKQCNMDLTAVAKNRFMELNELMELRDGAYENTRIYKERTKRWHDSRLRWDKNFKLGDKATSSQAWLWHRRLSHLNFDTINLLLKNDIVLHLLHMDLCGPMRVASINGKRYVLVIVDDYSRYTWTHFLRSKDETPEVLIDFLRLVQRGLQAHVKVNGVVDRQNRTLVEAARTMLSAAKVPLFFWAEAIATACFTQNHSLVIPRHEKTPYHIINERKPSVKFFHIFGSVCYIVRDGENLDKIKEKGDECIFLGSSAVSAADAPYQRQQPTTPLNNHTTPAPTCQDPSIATTVISSENINKAEPHVENDEVENDEFINIFSTPVQDQGETSTRHVDSSNMHTFYQRYPSEWRVCSRSP